MLDKDVVVRDEYFKGEKGYTDEDIWRQIIIINSLQKIMMGYYTDGSIRINSIIGKYIENVRVDIKRLKRDLENRIEKKDLNDMDNFLLENGEKIISQGELALNRLKEIDYMGIVRRSMKKNEISLGRVDESNIRVIEGLEVGTLKNVSYNLAEEDIYQYLKKVRRRKLDINIESYVDNYVRLANLNKDSREYINILLLIPYDSIKQWYKYRYNKRGLLPEEYLKGIRNSIIYESNIL